VARLNQSLRYVEDEKDDIVRDRKVKESKLNDKIEELEKERALLKSRVEQIEGINREISGRLQGWVDLDRDAKLFINKV